MSNREPNPHSGEMQEGFTTEEIRKVSKKLLRENITRSKRGEVVGYLVWGTIIALCAIGAVRVSPYIGKVIKAVEIQVERKHG